jgi:hypothetical protein
MGLRDVVGFIRTLLGHPELSRHTGLAGEPP